MKKAKPKAPKPAPVIPALSGRKPEVRAWTLREIADQERRYRKIVKRMEALEARRRRWIRQFYERIQARGFNVHADIKRKIPAEDIPPLPKGRIRVVF